jgi:hypothetical protein
MKFVNFDLRKASNLRNSAKEQAGYSQSNEFEHYMNTVKDCLAGAVTQGNFFLVSVDDSTVPYESIYDPDLKEFTSKDHFPNELFNLAEFKISEVWKRVICDTEYEDGDLSAEFGVILWSKFKVDDSDCVEDITEKLIRRFKVVLNLAKVDFLVWNRPDKHLANNYATVAGTGAEKRNASPAKAGDVSQIMGSKVESPGDATPGVDEDGNPINAPVDSGPINSSDSNPSDCE